MSAAMRHLLPAEFATRAWNVVVVGAGGTGSALLPNLARLHHAMLELGHPGGIECTVFDDDVVSPTNVGRQAFYPNDVGSPKGALLVNRLNLLMETNWQAVHARVSRTTRFYATDLVIGCVDTRAARHAILSACQASGVKYYLDCGNDTDRGQVLIGEVARHAVLRKKGEQPILPHVGQLFPELVDASQDAKDETPSCSMADALRKQSLFVNQAVAIQASNLIWTMFRTGAVPVSGVFVNLATGRTNPISIDPATWARFGYEERQPAKRKKKAAVAA